MAKGTSSRFACGSDVGSKTAGAPKTPGSDGNYHIAQRTVYGANTSKAGSYLKVDARYFAMPNMYEELAKARYLGDRKYSSQN